MAQLGVELDGWTLTGLALGFDNLVDVTIEKGGVSETFEKCSFGPEVDVMAWSVEQADRRAVVRVRVAEIEAEQAALAPVVDQPVPDPVPVDQPAPVEEVVENGANG